MKSEIFMEKDFTPKTAYRGALLAMLVPLGVALLIGMIFLIITPDGDGIIVNVLSSLFTEISFVLVAYYLCKKNQINFWTSTKINTKPKTGAICWAIGLSIVCLFLFSPIISLWESLLSLIGYNVQAELSYDLTSPGWIVYAFIGVALIPALCEETLFRGVILNGTRPLGKKFCLLYSALCFCLMHLSLQQLPYTFILGLISGLFMYYTQSIWPSVIFHFTNNATVLLWMCIPSIEVTLFGWWENLGVGLVVVETLIVEADGTALATILSDAGTGTLRGRQVEARVHRVTGEFHVAAVLDGAVALDVGDGLVAGVGDALSIGRAAGQKQQQGQDGEKDAGGHGFHLCFFHRWRRRFRISSILGRVTCRCVFSGCSSSNLIRMPASITSPNSSLMPAPNDFIVGDIFI